MPLNCSLKLVSRLEMSIVWRAVGPVHSGLECTHRRIHSWQQKQFDGWPCSNELTLVIPVHLLFSYVYSGTPKCGLPEIQELQYSAIFRTFCKVPNEDTSLIRTLLLVPKVLAFRGSTIHPPVIIFYLMCTYTVLTIPSHYNVLTTMTCLTAAISGVQRRMECHYVSH